VVVIATVDLTAATLGGGQGPEKQDTARTAD
jgi:hypothetical protein